ncbi:MAG TPA: DUF4239 domain-containing protein [Polyangia bacterium]|nr:DUF4239 domain-containing protein [Polyangia bacterium]
MKVQLIFGAMSLAVLVGMVAFQLLGRRFAGRRAPPDGARSSGPAAIEAAVFALLGLLVAFSFSGAETRLQNRRDLIVREVDAIGTAYLRLDLLAEADRAVIKEQLRRYVDARVTYYERLLDLDAARIERSRVEELQSRIWARAVAAAARAGDVRASLLLLPSLNEMFDVTTARDAALRMHIPLVIFVFLALLSFVCAFLAGMDMAHPERLSLLHVFMFAATMALTAYVILNLEFPRAGFVRLQYLDSMLAHLRTTMR